VGPESARGRAAGARARPDRLHPGHPQGGRRLRAAGPEVSRRAAGVHARRFRGRGAADAGVAALDASRPGRRRGGEHRRGGGGDPGRERRGPRERSGRADPGVRDLHLREHGDAQGSGGRAPQRGPARPRGRLCRLRPGRGGPAGRPDLLRRIHPGDLGPAAQRRPGGDAGGRPVAGRAGPHARAPGGDDPVADRQPVRRHGAGAAGRARRSPAAAGRGRRPAGGAGQGAEAALPRGPADQRVRAHREHDVHLLLHGPGRVERELGPHRTPDLEHAGLRAGPGAAPRAGGGAGRAVHRGRRRGARLPGTPGEDGGAVRSRPVRHGAGGADVPHGRPGAVDGGRHGGVPGPAGPAGQDPGIPDRARGDRGGALLAPEGARGAGDRARGPAGREAAGGVRGGRGGGGGGARAPAGEPAGVHGPGRGRGPGAPPPDAQREGGSGRAAGAGVRGGGGELRGAADAGGGGAGGDLGGGAAAGAGGGARRASSSWAATR
jgi:hypothetical protein